MKFWHHRQGFKDCARLIRFKAPEIVYVNAGEEILGSRVIGITPIPIGVDSKKGNCTYSIYQTMLWYCSCRVAGLTWPRLKK